MKLDYQYMAVFFNLAAISNHLHPLQVENCDSNSRLVVDDDDNGKLRDERVNNVGYNSIINIMIQYLNTGVMYGMSAWGW